MNYTVLKSPGLLKLMVANLLRSDLVAFDTETTSKYAEDAELVGMSFAVSRDHGWYVPVGHKEGDQLPLRGVLEAVRPALEAGVTCHGGKYDLRVMRKYGIEVNLRYDSLSIWRLLGQVEHGLGLKPTVKRVYEEEVMEFLDIVPKDQTFADVSIEDGAPYAIDDAINCWRLTEDGLENLSPYVKDNLLTVEIGAMRIASHMEDEGVPIDLDFSKTQIIKGYEIADLIYQDAVAELRRMVKEKGKEFPEGEVNLRSSKQLRHIIYDLAEYPVRKKTPKGAPATDQVTLERLAKAHGGAVDLVARYRSCMSFIGRFEELEKFAKNGRVHASLNPAGTSTGRWASSDPNVQNHPKDTSIYEGGGVTWEVAIRDAIAAPSGWYLVSSDYSQVELRVAAGESRESAWLDAFTSGLDIHTATAIAIFGEDEGPAKRQIGKTMNFSMLFGAQEKKVAEQLGISEDEASEIIYRFWKGLPEVQRWADGIHKFAVGRGYVETAFGRRRHLWGIDSNNKWERLRALRESVNTVVQGTAADILKIGLLAQEPVAQKFDARLFLTVHDQFVWLVPETVSPAEFCQAMDEVTCPVIEGYPEILADYGVGYRLGSLISYATAGEVPHELPLDREAAVVLCHIQRETLTEEERWTQQFAQNAPSI